MSVDSVRAFLVERAPDVSVIETAVSSATVEKAAEAHGVEPDQIAKTICIRAGEQAMLLVTSGRSRLDNRKFKDRFGAKPRMLGAEEVLSLTSHPVGGVCPFGLRSPLPVYCDLSLKRFDEVVPAAGATNAAVRISPQRIVALAEGEWVDVYELLAGHEGASEPRSAFSAAAARPGLSRPSRCPPDALPVNARDIR